MPLLNHVLDRLGVEAILERGLAASERRPSLTHAKALCVLPRSILVEREPVYRQQETVEILRQLRIPETVYITASA